MIYIPVHSNWKFILSDSVSSVTTFVFVCYMYLTGGESIQCWQTGSCSCDSPESPSKVNLKWRTMLLRKKIVSSLIRKMVCVCVCVCVCVNLADVVCSIGLYQLSVLSPGWSIIVTWQSVQILSELRAEGPCAGHTVTRHKETEYLIILTEMISNF